MKNLTPAFLAATVAAGATAFTMATQVDVSQAGNPAPETLDDLFETVLEEQEPVLGLDNGNFLSFHEIQQPIVGDAFTDYCERFAGNCDVQTEEYGMVTDPDIILAMDDINSRANASITPADDDILHGTTEYWTEAVMMDDTRPEALAGDCEDYVLYKMAELQKIGVPADAMSIVVVDPHGEDNTLHAVLAVRTADGDKILDNLTDRILHMQETGYTPIQATTFFNHGQWQGVSLTEEGISATVGDIYETYQPETASETVAIDAPIPAPRPKWR